MAHRHWVEKKEKPLRGESEITNGRHHHWQTDPTVNHGDGFDENGDACGVVGFDFDAVDEVTREFFEEANEDALHIAGTALGLILKWCWSKGFVTAQRRFATVSAALRPDLLGDESYKEIGKRLGCTRQSISKSAVNFEKTFRVKFSRGRSEEARQHMASAMIAHKKAHPRHEGYRNR